MVEPMTEDEIDRARQLLDGWRGRFVFRDDGAGVVLELESRDCLAIPGELDHSGLRALADLLNLPAQLLREVVRVRAENEGLREFIENEGFPGEAAALQADLDDLRARCAEALKPLLDSGTIHATVCPFCDETWPTEGCDRARVVALAAEHDMRCAKNPVRVELEAARAEASALRRAVIDLHDLELRQDGDAKQAWAIRQTANDLSAPFSERRVWERYARGADIEDRCTKIADAVVSEYRGGKGYSCTGIVAKRWQAAWNGACVALGYTPEDFDKKGQP